jgi:HAD superfamily hydrolase (TIGR01490 family)
LFDFDGTLTRRDTLMPFLRYVVGTSAFIAGIGRLAPQLLAYGVGVLANDVAKEAVLGHFLRGRRIGALRDAGEVFARQFVPKLTRADAIHRLRTHRTQGDACVLVTASVDVYVEPWGRAQGFDAILCSSLEIDGDRVTGRLEGGNCYGPEKARRIQRWLNGRQTERIWAYGDSRGDREMLELADVAQYRGRVVKSN